VLRLEDLPLPVTGCALASAKAAASVIVAFLVFLNRSDGSRTSSSNKYVTYYDSVGLN